MLALHAVFSKLVPVKLDSYVQVVHDLIYTLIVQVNSQLCY